MGYKEDIAAAKLQIENVTNETIIDVVLRTHTTLVSNPPSGTPIDFGWASSNWFISVGGPTTGNGGQLDADNPAAVGVREGQQASSVARFVTGYDYTNGQTVHIGNNVPYINRLNNGWSDQAPAGFVDDATQEAVTWANSRG
ncbi:neck protein [Vibrio phage 1.285.O._10N.286.55.C12]|nr:neck protein [Vibrio phage 1.285.O._10N.286.55.C12]